MSGDHEKEKPLQSAQPQALAAVPGEMERLFKEHHARIFRTAYRVTGSASDAEDVLQTIFLRLLKRRNLELDDAAAGYFHRAAVNAGLDLLRARSRSRAVRLEDSAPEELAVAGEAERAPERSELKDRLRRAIAKLSPKAAEIFTLRYIEGYGNTEIARMLGASRTTIAVTLHRARHRLKSELGSERGETS